MLNTEVVTFHVQLPLKALKSWHTEIILFQVHPPSCNLQNSVFVERFWIKQKCKIPVYQKM